MHCHLCRENHGAKSSATALTAQICHFDGYTYAVTGLLFTSCVTTTLWQCSDSTVAQTEKFDARDCTNSTVGETRVGSCAVGCELASGDSLRALTRVSKNESVACLTGSLPACQVTRCSTSTNPVSIGVSKDGEKTLRTAPLVKRLVPSALSLPTTLSSPGKITLCRLIPCAGKRSALTWPPLIRPCWRQIA